MFITTSSFDDNYEAYTYSACRTMASSICTFLLSVPVLDPNFGRFKDDALGGSGVESSVNPGVLLPTDARPSN